MSDTSSSADAIVRTEALKEILQHPLLTKVLARIDPAYIIALVTAIAVVFSLASLVHAYNRVADAQIKLLQIQADHAVYAHNKFIEEREIRSWRI